MKTISCFTVLFLFILPACKKDGRAVINESELTPAPEGYPSYSMLKKGNYWIYDFYEVKPDGSRISVNKRDSSYVEKDTVIGNYTYYKLWKYNYVYQRAEFQCLRDSLHYIVSPGSIVFSSQDSTTTFSDSYFITTPDDTVCRIQRKMADMGKVTVVPAGEFISCNMRTTYTFNPKWAIPGNNPRYRDLKYVRGVGLVVESSEMYAGSTYMTERRLIRFHVSH